MGPFYFNIIKNVGKMLFRNESLVKDMHCIFHWHLVYVEIWPTKFSTSKNKIDTWILILCQRRKFYDMSSVTKRSLVGKKESKSDKNLICTSQ